MVKILAPISVGDLADRITILELKVLAFPERADVAEELATLEGIAATTWSASLYTRREFQELRETNKELWSALVHQEKVINDDCHHCLDNATRKVIVLNKQRSRLKQQLSVFYDSEFKEAKTYT